MSESAPSLGSAFSGAISVASESLSLSASELYCSRLDIAVQFLCIDAAADEADFGGGGG
jgi:hypothetical protein